MQFVQDPWWKIRDKIKFHMVRHLWWIWTPFPVWDNYCVHSHVAGMAAVLLPKPDSQLWIWTPVPFWEIIVSDHVSHHLKEFKLHFNQFPILDVTATELTTILHPNRRLFTSEQALTCFHSLAKKFTLLHSVSVFQSQVPLHVCRVWQKTSLRCIQFQFFNPKSH